MRKTLLLTSALVFGSVSLTRAGGLPETVMEPAQVEQTTSSSAGGIIVPLLLVLLVAAVVSGNDSEELLLSDIRLKEDITRVGTNHLGLPVYQYRYKGMPEVWEGVMAQDVEILHPNAIKPLPYGYKAVDYSRLGLALRRVN